MLPCCLVPPPAGGFLTRALPSPAGRWMWGECGLSGVFAGHRGDISSSAGCWDAHEAELGLCVPVTVLAVPLP